MAKGGVDFLDDDFLDDILEDNDEGGKGKEKAEESKEDVCPKSKESSEEWRSLFIIESGKESGEEIKELHVNDYSVESKSNPGCDEQEREGSTIDSKVEAVAEKEDVLSESESNDVSVESPTKGRKNPKEPIKPKFKKKARVSKKSNKVKSIEEVPDELVGKIDIDYRGFVHVKDAIIFNIADFLSGHIDNDLVLGRFNAVIKSIKPSYGDSDYRKKISRTNYNILYSIVLAVGQEKMTQALKDMVKEIVKEHRFLEFVIKYKVDLAAEDNERGDVLYVEEF